MGSTLICSRGDGMTPQDSGKKTHCDECESRNEATSRLQRPGRTSFVKSAGKWKSGKVVVQVAVDGVLHIGLRCRSSFRGGRKDPSSKQQQHRSSPSVVMRPSDSRCRVRTPCNPVRMSTKGTGLLLSASQASVAEDEHTYERNVKG